ALRALGPSLEHDHLLSRAGLSLSLQRDEDVGEVATGGSSQRHGPWDGELRRAYLETPQGGRRLAAVLVDAYLYAELATLVVAIAVLVALRVAILTLEPVRPRRGGRPLSVQDHVAVRCRGSAAGERRGAAR